MRQPLRDNLGRTLGHTETLPTGDIRVFDAQGRYLGYWSPRTNRTTDALGRTLGTGNLLATLLR